MMRRLFRLPTSARQIDDDVDAELTFHLDARVRSLIDAGLDPRAADARARHEFGDVRLARAELRAMDHRRARRTSVGEWWATLRQDVRFALRSLRRQPTFLLSATLTLALGIGANAAIFSVVNAVLLKDLPFTDPARLVRVWATGKVPLGAYDIIRAESRAYAGFAGIETGRELSLTGDGAPARVLVSLVTPNAFDVLGVHPALGRGFAADAREPGRARVAVLSDALWRTRYGADANIVGRTIQLDGAAYSVAGVMPPSFRYPSGDVQLWTVATVDRASSDYWWGGFYTLVGRLAPGVTAAQARAEASTVFPHARAAFPMRMPDGWGRDVDVLPLRESISGSTRPTLLVLLAAVALVLLVACVNVATLSAERASGREREIAMRAALGAGRGRIARQLLTESLIVATLGAVAGIALAAIGLKTLVALLPDGMPRVDEIAIDTRVLLVTLGLTIVSGIAFGLLPARRAARQDVHSSLRSGARASSSTYAPRLLAGAQVAFAVVLVSSAGLLIKSFWQLQRVELGFRTDRVLTALLPRPIVTSDTLARTRAYYDAVLERARTVRGVRTAAVANGLPFGNGAYMAAMAVEDHPTPPGVEPPLPIVTWTSGDYFRTMSISLVRGRALTDADREGTPRVALIDEEGARRFWPGEDPIGRRIRYVWNDAWITVVGVVGSVRRDSLSASIAPSLYVPMHQAIAGAMQVVVQLEPSADANGVSRALSASLSAIDSTVPVGSVQPLRGVVTASAARPRFTMALLGTFALVAVSLGAVGIYGVVAAGVARRSREFGVRLALGATRGTIARMVLRDGTRITGAGVVIGLAGAIAGGRVLRGQLFGVAPTDPLVLLLVPVVLALVALVASIAPARRACRVDPIASVRAD